MAGHPRPDGGRAVSAARVATLAAAVAVAVAAVSACTDATAPQGRPNGPPAISSTSSTSTPSSASSAPTSPVTSSSPGTESRVPPTPTAGPTYFTPDPTSYALSGPVAVEAARQDPFSNLLQRGALHGQPVVLDVTGTPDEAWVPGSATLLFGTCRCPQRGSGLHLTLEDGSAIRDVGGGAVGIRGTFLPVVTASDAVTLRRAG